MKKGLGHMKKSNNFIYSSEIDDSKISEFQQYFQLEKKKKLDKNSIGIFLRHTKQALLILLKQKFSGLFRISILVMMFIPQKRLMNLLVRK